MEEDFSLGKQTPKDLELLKPLDRALAALPKLREVVAQREMSVTVSNNNVHWCFVHGGIVIYEYWPSTSNGRALQTGKGVPCESPIEAAKRAYAVLDAQGKTAPVTPDRKLLKAFIAAAQEEYHDEGTVEVDMPDEPTNGVHVSTGDTISDIAESGGVYVRAWVWVDIDLLTDEVQKKYFPDHVSE